MPDQSPLTRPFIPSCVTPAVLTDLTTSAGKTAKPRQAPAAELISSVQPIATSKKRVSKTSKSAKKKINPEIVPSEWDTSTKEDTKSDRPEPTTSAAPMLKKSSTNSDPSSNKKPVDKLQDREHDPFKSKKPVNKLTNREVLNGIHIKKLSPADKPTAPPLAPSVPTNQAQSVTEETKIQLVDPVVHKTTNDSEKSTLIQPKESFFTPSFPPVDI
ncbi:uncharacterized protein PGTG_17287 [Puccinia graminis f. sp. tritici CRL 75-36-700-3]|uniref:Uncharacterized protein n=2 Tax=Puccinia graminis f. sp. tritici TaxID=56615 RepID=E3L390_PUCGT|nr:uncharacterized protein PGTG_17287 [Puccinia graminis f. sp. tritici CRL 75-36-700-3]EFP91015.2 hypothetical protein PGTG_17287 [Puccinia graminis f. sp. tritici CRL 75-36-700-3]